MDGNHKTHRGPFCLLAGSSRSSRGTAEYRCCRYTRAGWPAGDTGEMRLREDQHDEPLFDFAILAQNKFSSYKPFPPSPAPCRPPFAHPVAGHAEATRPPGSLVSRYDRPFPCKKSTAGCNMSKA